MGRIKLMFAIAAAVMLMKTSFRFPVRVRRSFTDRARNFSDDGSV